ncbi:MAG: hypothetical protein ABIB71_07325 [Candidatus Woesearchaeota archaeon]
MTPTTFYHYEMSMPHPYWRNDMGYGSSSYLRREDAFLVPVQRMPSPPGAIALEIVQPPKPIELVPLKFTETFGRLRFRWEERESFKLDIKLPKLELNFSHKKEESLEWDYWWKKRQLI